MQLPLPLHTEAQRAASAVPRAAGDQIDDAAGGFRCIGRGESGRRHHRAGAKALAAARAGVGDRLAARSEVLEIRRARATSVMLSPQAAGGSDRVGQALRRE